MRHAIRVFPRWPLPPTPDDHAALVRSKTGPGKSQKIGDGSHPPKKRVPFERCGDKYFGAIEPMRGWPGLHRTRSRSSGSMVVRYVREASIDATDDDENITPRSLTKPSFCSSTAILRSDRSGRLPVPRSRLASATSRAAFSSLFAFSAHSCGPRPCHHQHACDPARPSASRPAGLSRIDEMPRRDDEGGEHQPAGRHDLQSLYGPVAEATRVRRDQQSGALSCPALSGAPRPLRSTARDAR
jgi:hypothetical protein